MAAASGRSAARTLHLLLALANFAVGMGAFVVVGVLSPIATDLGIDKADAGWLMTIYAVVYAVASPVLVSLTGRFDRARLLVLGLGLLLAGSVLAALAPSYGLLLAARALTAVGSALVAPVAAAVGVASVESAHRGAALATVFGGFTMAQALGVPFGAWLGYSLGWRTAFLGIAALALIAAVVLYRMVPRGLVVQPASLRTLASVLGTLKPVAALSFTALFLASIFVLYTFLGPFLESRHGLDRSGMTAMLLVFGLGAVFGNAVGGFLTDRIGPVSTLVTLCVGQIVLMPLLTLAQLPLLATGIVIAAWSVVGWAANVPQQARLTGLDPAKAPVMLALHSSAIYVGSSVGSMIGGRSLALAGHDALGPAGAVIALLALASLGVVAWMGRSAAPAGTADACRPTA